MKHLVAIGQMTSTNDIEANFSICEMLVQEASERSAKLISLPENFAYMADASADNKPFKEPLDGPLMLRYLSLAKKHNIWLSLGGFPETSPKAGKHYNTHVIVNDHGKITATYSKLHLLSAQIKNRVQVDESATVEHGDKLVTAQSPIGMLGVSICYDVRFGEMYVAMAQAGAQVMLIPAAFMSTTGKAHWEILLRARAIESQSYVIAAAQTGIHNAMRRSYGHAMIVDPWGTIVAQCSEGIGIATAEIDFAYLTEVRGRLPVLHHRRHQVYDAFRGLQLTK